MPAPVVECTLGPAMVLSDDCAIGKEFNLRVGELMSEGIPEEEAVRLAKDDMTLDSVLMVAPILPYSSLRFAKPASVASVQAVVYFPMIASPEMDAGYVDLGRMQSVSRHVLGSCFAALSERAKHYLRWKLAQYSAARNFSTDEDEEGKLDGQPTRPKGR